MTVVRHVLAGLILGESLSWTGMFERSALLPYWTRRKRREIETEHDTDGLLETTLPFALNQNPKPLYPGAGAHTEWFVFQLSLLREGAYDRERVLAAWRDLAEAEGVRPSLAQRAALDNLRRGLGPPVSGHDNPHYFDDGACFRALATACCLEGAYTLEAVTYDASLTNAEDGLWGALAVAAFVAATGAPLETRLERALAQLPEGSWSRTNAELALTCARESSSVFALSARLSRQLATYAYSYGNAAAETVPAALAILAATGAELERSMLAALALPRLAGSLVPLVGALCGAYSPEGLPLAGLERPLVGLAFPAFAGHSPADYLPHPSSGGERTIRGTDT